MLEPEVGRSERLLELIWVAVKEFELSSHNMLGGPPHPVIVTLIDNEDYIRVLLYSYYYRVGGSS